MEISKEQKGYVTQAFRQALQNAFKAGQAYELTDHAADVPTFDEWFDKRYGDIFIEGYSGNSNDR